MSQELITIVLPSILSELFHAVSRWIVPKKWVRITYREKLKDIVCEFIPCLQDVGYSGNLEEIIGEGIRAIKEKSEHREIVEKLNSQLNQVSSLTKRLNSFYKKIDHSYPSSTTELFQEFTDILSDSKQIFYNFIHTLYSNLDKDKWEDISQELKMNTRGYPAFERIWNDVVNTLMHVSREAHKVLPEISTLETFVSLPKL